MHSNLANNYMQLANGNSWRFMGTSQIEEWMEKLRFIMKLNNHEIANSQRILFAQDINILKDQGFIDSIDSFHLWNERPLRIYLSETTPDIVCEIGDNCTPAMEGFMLAQSVIPVYVRAMRSGGLPLHAALIKRDNICVAISAPSGIGKSTCASRLSYPWSSLCDDEILIVRDGSGNYHAHPFPTWSRCRSNKLRESWNIQTHMPISAIFFLKQSERTMTIPITQSDAMLRIYELSSFNFFIRIFISRSKIPPNENTLRKYLFENACDIAKYIPAYILETSLTGNFWEDIDRDILKDQTVYDN